MRVGPDGGLEGLGVVGGEGAQGVLHAVAELAEHARGDVLGRLGHEEDADALGADEADGLLDGFLEGLARVGEEQVRLVEEEDELGLVDVADLGEVVEEVREHPHEEGREERRPVLHAGQLEAGHETLAVRRRAKQVAGLERRLTEERVGALVLEGDELAQDDTGRRGREATERLELRLALVTHEVADDGAQVLEVEEQEAVLVGVVEDEPEAGLLRVVEAEHLGEQRRTEVGDRRADRRCPCPGRRGTRTRSGMPWAASPVRHPWLALRSGRSARPGWPCRTGRP